MRDLRLWLGTAVSLAFLALFFARVDAGAVWEAFRRVDPVWLLIAMPIFIASVWVRALRWRLIIAPHVALSGREATALVVIGYAANNILPARTGEVVRALLVQRRHGGSSMTALGTIVVERIFDGLVLALMLATTIAVAGGTGPLRVLALAMGVLFVIVALVLLALALRPLAARRVLERLLGFGLRPAPAALGTRVRALAQRFLDGLTLLRGARTWLLVASASTLGWVLEAAAYWVVGIAFGLDLPPGVYLAVCAAANLAIAAPSTAGGIGPYEFFAREALVFFGATTAAGTAYALALHAFVLLPITLAGLVLLWRRRLRLGSFAHATATDAMALDGPGAGDTEQTVGERA